MVTAVPPDSRALKIRVARGSRCKRTAKKTACTRETRPGVKAKSYTYAPADVRRDQNARAVPKPARDASPTDCLSAAAEARVDCHDGRVSEFWSFTRFMSVKIRTAQYTSNWLHVTRPLCRVIIFTSVHTLHWCVQYVFRRVCFSFRFFILFFFFLRSSY